ncbi:MAG: hypothetical protein ABIJ03_00750 [Patescibacteria group bacterium]|nr:hypothetical protein [Patescibacteria group bacterium]
MTYNSLLAAGLIDPALHSLIADHPDSIQMQKLLCQALMLRLLHQLSAHSPFPANQSLIKKSLDLESWTDIFQNIQKIDKTLAQNMVESIKRIEFVLINQLTESAE